MDYFYAEMVEIRNMGYTIIIKTHINASNLAQNQQKQIRNTICLPKHHICKYG